MDEESSSARSDAHEKSNARDELRTMAFRLREIQRLLGMRVQQENRRLEADGLEPVTEATFVKQETRPPETTEE